jgi:sugar-specific transcriptional regulator TrmB
MLGLRFSPKVKEYSANEFSDKVSELLNLAKREILISTYLDPKFYNKEEVKEAFESAVERGVDVKILLDKDAYPITEVGWINKLYQDNKIKVKQSYDKIPHVIIIDELHLREETLHEKGNYKDVKNTIIEYAYGLALRRKFEFLEWWNAAEKIAKEVQTIE